MSTEITPRRVAIIEDEGIVAMLVEDMLVDLGYEVVATIGRMDQAAQLVSETSVDVVLLDLNLNGEHTYSLASALASRGIPFIFATGYGSAGQKEAACRSGASPDTRPAGPTLPEGRTCDLYGDA